MKVHETNASRVRLVEDRMRAAAILLVGVLAPVAAMAAPGPAVSMPAVRPAAGLVLLPQSFAGLRAAVSQTGAARSANAASPQKRAVSGDSTVQLRTGAAAADADPAHSALLREDGLIDAAQAVYAPAGEAGTQAGPKTITVRAWRFADATGAYSAFTAYREPQMHPVVLGVDGSSLDGRYLFWTGSTLVEATVATPGPDTLATLRSLAAALPQPHGTASVPPPVRGYLPTAGLEPESVHYAIGPAGYAVCHSPLPESVIDFSRDAEVITAHYHGVQGTGSLTLINYPTPQIAGDRRRAIAALIENGGAGGAASLQVGDPSLAVERIGPLVAFTSGSLTQAQAHALIRSVHLDEVVTINHPEGYVSEVSKAAKLLLGIAYLTGTLAAAAVLLALFLGAGRVLIRRMRGKPASSMNDDDFISLKLD